MGKAKDLEKRIDEALADADTGDAPVAEPTSTGPTATEPTEEDAIEQARRLPDEEPSKLPTDGDFQALVEHDGNLLTISQGFATKREAVAFALKAAHEPGVTSVSIVKRVGSVEWTRTARVV